MAFTEQEKNALLALKGIGPTILKRLEEMGLDDITILANTSPEFILSLGAQLTQSSCWKNSPQAKKAIQTAVNWAQQQTLNEPY